MEFRKRGLYSFSSSLTELRNVECLVVTRVPSTDIELLYHDLEMAGFRPSCLIGVFSGVLSPSVQQFQRLRTLHTSVPNTLFSVYKKKRSLSLSSVIQLPMVVSGAQSHSIVISEELGCLCLVIAHDLFDFCSMSFCEIRSAFAIDLTSVPVIPEKISESLELMFLLYGLDLSGQRLTLHCLDFIAHHCPNLQDLNLEGCLISYELSFLTIGETFFTNGIRSISNGCPKLRSLNLAGICLKDAVKSCSILSTMFCLECLGVSCCTLVQPKLVSTHGRMLSPVLDPDAKRSISGSLASMKKLRAVQVWPCATQIKEHNAVSVLLLRTYSVGFCHVSRWFT